MHGRRPDLSEPDIDDQPLKWSGRWGAAGKEATLTVSFEAWSNQLHRAPLTVSREARPAWVRDDLADDAYLETQGDAQ